MFTTGKTVGLAEWITDDTCLVFIFQKVSCAGNCPCTDDQPSGCSSFCIPLDSPPPLPPLIPECQGEIICLSSIGINNKYVQGDTKTLCSQWVFEVLEVYSLNI